MKKQQVISVIVPAYNTGKYIEKCLDSLMNQTYSNIEILVINDGSTDNTLEVLKKYESNSKCVLKIFTQKNSGQGSARNVGIKNATGEYITFVDSDDYIKENMLEILYNKIIEENADISVCDIIKKYDDKDIVYKNLIEYNSDNKINYILSHPGPVARLYKRDLFVKNNIYFLEDVIYEDLGTMPLIGIKAKKVVYIEEACYYYIIRKGSTMNQQKFSNKLYDIFAVLDHLSKNFAEGYKEELEFLYIEHLLRSASLRFCRYENATENLDKVVTLIKAKYPNWQKNKYYKKANLKFKFICNCAFAKNVLLLTQINKFVS